MHVNVFQVFLLSIRARPIISIIGKLILIYRFRHSLFVDIQAYEKIGIGICLIFSILVSVKNYRSRPSAPRPLDWALHRSGFFLTYCLYYICTFFIKRLLNWNHGFYLEKAPLVDQPSKPSLERNGGCFGYRPCRSPEKGEWLNCTTLGHQSLGSRCWKELAFKCLAFNNWNSSCTTFRQKKRFLSIIWELCVRNVVFIILYYMVNQVEGGMSLNYILL